MRVPQPGGYEWPKWAGGMRLWAEALTQALASALNDDGMVRLPAFPKAKLPSAAASKWCVVIVKDDVNGEVPAWSDGTDWRRVTDRAIIS